MSGKIEDLITTDARDYYNDQVYIPGTSFPRRRQYFDNKERNKICTATTVNLSEIGESDRFVQMKSYKCKQCHYTSNKFYNLRRHVLTKHDMNNALVCQICGRSCGDNFQLRMHTENVHGTGEKKFECPFSHCPKKFSWKCGLQSHIKKCPFRESER